ncbi:MAG TPA: hypothetical protein VJ063_06765 [Verrucomicrobiae bacterium]|nr:hypothetical protein [Verrucomicrobiae bacterium]
MTRRQTFFNWIHSLRASTAWPFVIAALLSGCAHAAGPQYRTGSGDAGTFIVRQAVLRGAEPLNTEELPRVAGSWTYAKDDSGVIIRIPAKEHATVEALLLRAFGNPMIGPVDTQDGRRVGAYRLTRNGASLQFARGGNWTQVIVLRERTEKDNAADFLRGLQ